MIRKIINWWNIKRCRKLTWLDYLNLDCNKDSSKHYHTVYSEILDDSILKEVHGYD